MVFESTFCVKDLVRKQTNKINEKKKQRQKHERKRNVHGTSKDQKEKGEKKEQLTLKRKKR